MKFGPVPLAAAAGAIAAHSIRTDGLVVKKGTRLGRVEMTALAEAGVAEVVVAQLEPGDVHEDAAAAVLAARIAGPRVRVDTPFTGRSNLFAESDGVLTVDRVGVDAFNALDEAITLATLPEMRPVRAGDMVGTVKIIPFAVTGARVDEALARCGALLSVVPFVRRQVAVISTLLPGLLPKVVEKTLRITAERLARGGARITQDIRILHDTSRLSAAMTDAVAAGAELVIVFGASAITDRRDVIPAALEAAGGRVDRLGMPVDPGNLTLLGRLKDVPVIGAPGCARSAKENGFDWALMRILAGMEVTAQDVAGLGVGGLLMEIVTRPQPRLEPPPERPPQVAAVVLAAGRGTRMGGPNKLLEEVGGVCVVRRVVEAALASRAQPVLVVTGHEHGRVEAVLAGLPVIFTHNPDFATGMASSVRRGIAAVPPEADGAVILLGDMPLVAPALLDRLVEAFAPDQGRLIIVPMDGEMRGNPVLWSRRFFPDLAALEGDVGARRLISVHPEAVFDVPFAGTGAFLDVDTPEALAQARAQLAGAAAPDRAAP